MLVIPNLLSLEDFSLVKRLFDDGIFEPIEPGRPLKAMGCVAEPTLLHTAKQTIAQALVENDRFKKWARPRAVLDVEFNRHDALSKINETAWHVLPPQVNSHRADLAFTFFANDGYEGGLHEIDALPDTITTPRAYSPNTVMVYPANVLQRVQPVTHSTRDTANGTIMSYVRDHAKRELLWRLADTIHDLKHGGVDNLTMDRLNDIETNLIRMWSE